MTHRLLGITALAAATALTMTACGNSSSAPVAQTDGEVSGEVTMWMYPVIKDEAKNREFWEKTEKAFESENPDVDFNVELQTFDKRDTQISAALAANSGPDIVMITPDQASTYHEVGGLLPVDEAIDDEKDSFYTSGIEAATIEDQVYGVPMFQNVNTTAYNKEIFEEAGLELPKTWEDIKEAAPILAEKDISVLEYVGSPEQTLNLTFYPFLWQAGGSIFTEDGSDIAFDSPEGIEALQFILDLQEMGGVVQSAGTDSPAIEGSPMARGQVALRATTSLPELAQLRGALGEETVVLGEPLEGEVQATFGNPGLMALTSINEEDNRQAAYAVLDFLSTAEFQSEFTKLASNFPTRTDVELPGTGPDYEALEAALEYAIPGEPHAAARQVMAALAPYLQSALRGDLSAEEALTQAAEEARGILSRT
ncbi:multiple sugar transport system substrate-binding protein [Arthrobacter pigmenti]|uniref:Multiple sugar transport system substrate-binding protein n=1 Tax=Arthrobacter pigmenti TaxID=271432 RepID=A0A846RDQ9_9MICC|nr:extracellular solute-binding protein [Arthrobacter pigmenti]NJC21143.1 multiple sugar transport system substrate-binding protein [Arthrobacter pigmenti]